MRAVVAVAGWPVGAAVVCESIVFISDTGDQERNEALALEAVRQHGSQMMPDRAAKNTCACLTDDA